MPPWRNEELALHVVTSHCQDGREGPPRGRESMTNRGNTGETSTHTVTQVRSKDENPTLPSGAAWRGQGLEYNTRRMPAPCGRCRSDAEFRGWSSKSTGRLRLPGLGP